jgi:hypothetical protein
VFSGRGDRGDGDGVDVEVGAIIIGPVYLKVKGKND